MKHFFVFVLMVLVHLDSSAQKDSSKLNHQMLPEITVKSVSHPKDLDQLEAIHGLYLCPGLKNEVICLSKKDVALTEKYARQIFAKVPGVFVYDMDGTGNQMNISVRGLDPHRGWEFNIRKDYVITNSDMYGYPASHYNIPMEAVDKIELIRGTGAVQYGAQFGGMLNYVSKAPDTSKSLAYETINTIGSYDLVSTFHRFSGKLSKWQYNVWANKKWNGGFRKNGDSEYDAQAIQLKYQPNEKWALNLEWTHSNYVIHLAGALSDSMFNEDPQQSTRARNYYNPDIHVPSINILYTPNQKFQWTVTGSAVKGYRNSVMFDKPLNVQDIINPNSLQYANRQVDIDQFNSYTIESRALYKYDFLHIENALVVGFQYMNNDLWRRQQGVGTTGSDYDLTVLDNTWGRDMHFKTQNIAFFAENLWKLSPRLLFKAGIRYEHGQSDLTGKIKYYSDSLLPNTIRHRFPLFAASGEYDLNQFIKLYSGWSQAYRPVIFKDIIPASVYETVDKDLLDANGYNFEAGIRGQIGTFRYDVNYFRLGYNNRLGTLAETDALGSLIIHRTNIGDALTQGTECSVQWDAELSSTAFLSLSNSTAFMNAIYKNAELRSGSENVNIDGNKVESTPEWIIRNGLLVKWRKWSFNLLHSYTSESYADALNTVAPNATGSVGLVPSYHLVDLSLSVNAFKNVKLTLNVNNAFDKQYFTKRPQFYPGPGIWPSDGRTWSCTVKLEM